MSLIDVVIKELRSMYDVHLGADYIIEWYQDGMSSEEIDKLTTLIRNRRNELREDHPVVKEVYLYIDTCITEAVMDDIKRIKEG